MKLSTVRIAAIVALVPFTILTVVAVWIDGIAGIFTSIVSSWGSLQIYVDLVIALIFIMVWMYRDLKKQGRNPWPWIVATLAVGAFSPLIYLLVRDERDD